MRHIVVLGTGFAGLHAIAHLERALKARRRTQLTVITDRPDFLFTPLLPNVANGQLSMRSITLPLKEALDDDTRLILGRVTRVDLSQRVVHTRQAQIPFDYIIMAPGSRVDWRGHQDFAPHSLTCKTKADAERIRATLASAYREAAYMPAQTRARHLTFAFAGAGPTGVELAAELHAALKRDLFPRAAPELVEATRFLVIDPADSPLRELPEALGEITRRHFDQQGIELILNARVTHRQADHIVLQDVQEIPCDHFFWCAGVTASEVIARTEGLSTHADGRALVDETLQATEHEGVFVVGDSASTPGRDAQNAQVARQQGPLAAHNLLAAMSGRTPRVWARQHIGDLITLGQGKAAISLLGTALEGLPAYAMYRLAYAGLMPGPMKKLRIITEWLEHDLATLSSQQDALLDA